jgi:heme a synthase
MKEFASDKGKKCVAAWIITGVVMLLIQVVLGGVTRLTGSGLSITEWNVVTGTLPPLNEAAWLKEFSKYQQTPQYRLLNTGFTLEDFKFIFFWEWFHRFWARMIGVVFLVGFIYLVSKRYLKKEMHQPLMLLFFMGAMQGAIGWIMVASGLTGDAIYVKPTRLALHFIFAIGLIAYAWWFALQLTVNNAQVSVDKNARKKVWILIILVGVQLIFGALMAGHKAATAAPTWPDINGTLLPDHAFSTHPFIRDLVENKITIHFIHRTLAYILLVLISWFAIRMIRKGKTMGVRRHAKYPLVFVWIQVLLGIFSVLLSVNIVPNHWGSFEWMAQLHQVVGMLLLLSLVSMLYFLRTKPIYR